MAKDLIHDSEVNGLSPDFVPGTGTQKLALNLGKLHHVNLSQLKVELR